MKKFIALFLIAACLMGLVACKPITATDNNAESFVGKVLEVHDETILVRPIAGSAERNSSDKIVVPNSDKNITAGSFVKIIYNGEILESYPAQIPQATVELCVEEYIDIPSLENIENYTTDALRMELQGINRDQLRMIWGNPTKELDNIIGDAWVLNEEQNKQIIVYYNNATRMVDEVTMNVNADAYPAMHVYQGAELFCLNLWNSGTFHYNIGTNARIGMGTWVEDENGLIQLTEYIAQTTLGESAKTVNYFRKVTGGIAWVEELSDGFPGVDLTDGATFSFIPERNT